MPRHIPRLWFDGRAEEAAQLCCAGRLSGDGAAPPVGEAVAAAPRH